MPLNAGSSIVGVVPADQITSLDWRAHLADFAEGAAPATLRSVRRLVGTLLELT